MGILKTLAITLFIFLSPIMGLLGLISFAVFFDTAFAIYVSIKMEGLGAFKSTKLFNIVVKTFFYMGSIVFSFLIDTYIMDGKLLDIPFLISKVVTVLWVYIEVKSIDETSKKYGNRSLWVVLKELISKTKDLKKDINDI